MSLAYQAMLFARQAHAGHQRRYTGAPYADHLAEVAGIVATAETYDPIYNMDGAMIAVAWLHDCVEDVGVTAEQLHAEFGWRVARGVMLLSDLEEGTLNSITRVPVTVDHPLESVTAENWSRYAVGEVGDAYSKEPEWIVVNPMVKDAAAIQAARTTHREISMGYEAEIVAARDGIDADFEMRDIRMNHLALVPAARAGSAARIGDSWGVAPVNDFQPGGKPATVKGGHMSDTLKTVVLGDKAVQVAVSDVAAIEQYKADSAKALKDAQDALTKAQSDHATVIAAKDETIGTLRADLQAAKDAAVIDVDALVVARTELVAKVAALDSSIDPKGLSDADLRKAAVAAKLGDEMVKDASEAEILGMFKALTKDAKTGNPVADVIKRGVQSNDGAAVNDAQAGYIARLTRQTKEA